MSANSNKRKASGKTTKKDNTLPRATVEYLKNWMMSPAHIEYPYPNEEEKEDIIAATGISNKQLMCWFSNNRKRFWKPKMEEMGRGDLVESVMGNTLDPNVVEYLKAWMLHPDHIENPYPTEEEKAQIISATGIEKKQLVCWFSNNRKRFWKPKMDELRRQYGLGETDPLPPALVATVSSPNEHVHINQNTALAALPLDASIPPDLSSAQPSLPLDFPSFHDGLQANFDVGTGDHDQPPSPSENKRRKVSSSVPV